MNNLLRSDIKDFLLKGTVIPAHPLALHEDRSIDIERQKLLTKYYIKSGAGGIAVGVHTTQFEIRRPEINLFETVLRIAAEEIDNASLKKPFIKVAGICGETAQAVHEAAIAVKHGYHLGLLSMGQLNHFSEDELIDRVKAVSDIIPVFGFYLQPAVGGRLLPFSFWKKFVEIRNVHAIKVAAFNRYQTMDVVRAVCESERVDEIALYTGNDDNIIADLLTPYRFNVDGKEIEKRFCGGLLGHWAVWTSVAVRLLEEIKQCIENNYRGIDGLLARNIQVTDMNAAIFDAENSFRGCIPGIHEVLRRQKMLNGIWCLDKNEILSEKQSAEIDRVYKMYPDLTDDGFVSALKGRSLI